VVDLEQGKRSTKENESKHVITNNSMSNEIVTTCCSLLIAACLDVCAGCCFDFASVRTFVRVLADHSSLFNVWSQVMVSLNTSVLVGSVGAIK
jgi:hypothetical protein